MVVAVTATTFVLVEGDDVITHVLVPCAQCPVPSSKHCRKSWCRWLEEWCLCQPLNASGRVPSLPGAFAAGQEVDGLTELIYRWWGVQFFHDEHYFRTFYCCDGHIVLPGAELLVVFSPTLHLLPWPRSIIVSREADFRGDQPWWRSDRRLSPCRRAWHGCCHM